jgi:hypothetical protein
MAEHHHDKELAALGFSELEIGAINWVLIRMGVIPTCEHTRPRFVQCFELDKNNPGIDEGRWQQFMREMGFRVDAITLAESAIFNEGKRGAA